eukprot:TRINITY_DN6718_c0_g1_i1.p1 TRINITY_DN6718_c0_g1~~TRINITY_DN6718_c0_g1_i1.p1  ORF type:complete len:645 (+),score=198.74 TRINITY_DN6718_c0_g1_i1:101-2035(+)
MKRRRRGESEESASSTDPSTSSDESPDDSSSSTSSSGAAGQPAAADDDAIVISSGSEGVLGSAARTPPPAAAVTYVGNPDFLYCGPVEAADFQGPVRIPPSTGQSYPLRLGGYARCKAHGLPKCAGCVAAGNTKDSTMEACCKAHHDTPEKRAALAAIVPVCPKHFMTKCSHCPTMKRCCEKHHVCKTHGKGVCDLCASFPGLFKHRTPAACCRRGHHVKGFDPAAAVIDPAQYGYARDRHDPSNKAKPRKPAAKKVVVKAESPPRKKRRLADPKPDPAAGTAGMKAEGAVKPEPGRARRVAGRGSDTGGASKSPALRPTRPDEGGYRCGACGKLVVAAGAPAGAASGSDNEEGSDEDWFIAKRAVCECRRQNKAKKTSKTHTQKGFRCTFPGCDKVFTLNSNMKRHLKTHTAAKDDDTKEKKFACPHCDKEYVTKQALTDHVRYKHSKNRKEFTCAAGCGFLTEQRGKLRLHYKSSSNCNEQAKLMHRKARRAAEQKREEKKRLAMGGEYSEVEIPPTPDIPAIDLSIHQVPAFTFQKVTCPHRCGWWASATFSLVYHLAVCNAVKQDVKAEPGAARPSAVFEAPQHIPGFHTPLTAPLPPPLLPSEAEDEQTAGELSDEQPKYKRRAQARAKLYKIIGGAPS